MHLLTIENKTLPCMLANKELLSTKHSSPNPDAVKIKMDNVGVPAFCMHTKIMNMMAGLTVMIIGKSTKI